MHFGLLLVRTEEVQWRGNSRDGLGGGGGTVRKPRSGDRSALFEVRRDEMDGFVKGRSESDLRRCHRRGP
jgi:hypothetical protein